MREEGYYWIKETEFSQWVVAEWNEVKSGIFSPGYFRLFCDINNIINDAYKVDENQILRNRDKCTQ